MAGIIFKILVGMENIINLKTPLKTTEYGYINHNGFDIVEVFFIVCLWPFMSLFYFPAKILGIKVVTG